MITQSKKDQFLNNKENKQRFLVYLSDELERAGCITDHAKHDADVLIVQTAIASARTKDTVLAGDDTDLLVLLLHHAGLNVQELFLAPEPKKATKTRQIWCIKQTKELLAPKVCGNILFIHAIRLWFYTFYTCGRSYSNLDGRKLSCELVVDRNLLIFATFRSCRKQDWTSFVTWRSNVICWSKMIPRFLAVGLMLVCSGPINWSTAVTNLSKSQMKWFQFYSDLSGEN